MWSQQLENKNKITSYTSKNDLFMEPYIIKAKIKGQVEYFHFETMIWFTEVFAKVKQNNSNK